MRNKSIDRVDRTHEVGSGIRQAYPEPAENFIDATAQLPLPDLPYLDPTKQGAMLARFKQHGSGYALMTDRYTGGDAWSAVDVPTRYRGTGPQDAFFELWNAYKGGTEFCLIFPWDEVGKEAFYSFGNETSGTISAVQDPYTPAIEQDRVKSGGVDSGGWNEYASTGLIESTVLGPVGRVDWTFVGGGTGYLIRTAESSQINLKPYYLSKTYDCVDMAIFLVMWGKIPRPDSAVGPRFGVLQPDQGQTDDAWIRQTATVAGRVLWQMAWLEYVLMVDDLCQRNKGGRGGLAGRGKAGGGRPGAPNKSVIQPWVTTPSDAASVLLRSILDAAGDADDLIVPALEALFGGE